MPTHTPKDRSADACHHARQSLLPLIGPEVRRPGHPVRQAVSRAGLAVRAFVEPE